MALKLGAAFRTTPESWLNAQKAVDLDHAAKHLGKLPEPLIKASWDRLFETGERLIEAAKRVFEP